MTTETDLTSDIGFKVNADRLDRLFEEAGSGLMNLIVDVHSVLRMETKHIDLFAPTLEELMHTWLVEICYLFDYEHLLLSEFVVEVFNDDSRELRIHATVSGEHVDEKRHSIHNRVKGVLVNNQKITQEEDGSWTAEVCAHI